MPLSPASMAKLGELLARHAHGAAPEVATLAPLATERSLEKGAAFLEGGSPARLAAIVVDGVFGEFYVGADGKRKAKWLAGPGDAIGSMEDLVRDGPARATILALTAGTVVAVPYAKLRALALQQRDWSGFFVQLMEDFYRRKSEREYTLLMLKAEERYRWFQEHYGAIEARVSQEIVASYLGITPVHLSRVRRSVTRRAGS